MKRLWWVSCGDIEGPALNKGQGLTATATANNKLNSCHKKKISNLTKITSELPESQQDRETGKRSLCVPCWVCACPVVYLTPEGKRRVRGMSLQQVTEPCVHLAHHSLQSLRSVFPAHAPARRTQAQHGFPSPCSSQSLLWMKKRKE